MKRVLLFLCTLVTGVTVLAQTYQEVVYLKNGSIIKGTVIEQVPGVSLKVQTADGSVFVYKMEEVEKITKEETARKKPSAKGASGVFVGGRFSVEPGVSLTFGEYSFASVTMKAGWGKDLSENLYLGVGAGVAYAGVGDGNWTPSAFLANRIYFPMSPKMNFVLKNHIGVGYSAEAEVFSFQVGVMPGFMVPVSGRTDLLFSIGYLGNFSSGHAGHALGIGLGFDFHRAQSGPKEYILRERGIELGGSLRQGVYTRAPGVGFSIGYRYDLATSFGLEIFPSAKTFRVVPVEGSEDCWVGMKYTTVAAYVDHRFHPQKKASPIVKLSAGLARITFPEYLYDDMIPQDYHDEGGKTTVMLHPAVGYSFRFNGSNYLDVLLGGLLTPKFEVPGSSGGSKPAIKTSISSPALNVTYHHTFSWGQNWFK